MEKQSIYIVLSQTVSMVGKAIRKITKDEYTHVSLSFDEKLNVMYSFSREEIEYPLVGVASTETLNKYFLGREEENIKMKVYKIDLSPDEYRDIKTFVNHIFNDNEGYMYNFLEPLNVFTGMSLNCYKTYVCSTFVFDALKAGNIVGNINSNSTVSPQELGNILEKYLYYDGLINRYEYFKESIIKFKRRKFKVIISPMKTTAFYTYVVCRHLKKSISKNYMNIFRDKLA